MRKFFLVLPLLLLLLSCAKNTATKAPTSTLNEPDRVLFERAMKDLEKSRFTVGRLTLQTLISTYPDSEFLPQAKYAMAESFYREATSTALSQAENEFKDYITFFPTSPLADDAQMKIAMTHVKRLEKADRDKTQAQLAEVEFKSFIESYPDSPLLNEAKQKLRELLHGVS
jgi:outer membrane protein assembly factor BamD